MRDSVIVIPVGILRRVLVVFLVLVALILVVVVVRTQVLRAGSIFGASIADVLDASAYQAVFLTNGSTYFGKLGPQGGDWFVLSDVFYLSSSDQSGTQLIKRGNEPQGPKEPMIVSRQQVLFVENLREDSDIVSAIKKFKSGELPAATRVPATTTPPTSAPSGPRPSPTPTR